jgi:serine/threonine-protein kinase
MTSIEQSYDSGDVIDGRYRIEKLLGRGMSEVYEVVDEVTGEWRALKILPTSEQNDPGHRVRLLREAEATRRINHPNIVHICGVAPRDAAVPYFVMELLRGETMRQYLDRVGPMPPARALDLIREAAAGLAAAHAQHIFHRDVKPDNLFLCGTEEKITGLKVIDFGLAKTTPPGTDGPDSVLSGPEVMGTAEYMAPEQVVADPADARSDVYSLGVVTFRLITRELPFDGVSSHDLLAHQLASISPPPSWLVDQLDEGVDTLILTAVRKHPDNRYPDMQAMLEDIERVIRGQVPRGVPLKRTPDQYEPRSALGRTALQLLTRRHSSRPPSAPLQEVARPEVTQLSEVTPLSDVTPVSDVTQLSEIATPPDVVRGNTAS